MVKAWFQGSAWTSYLSPAQTWPDIGTDLLSVSSNSCLGLVQITNAAFGLTKIEFDFSGDKAMAVMDRDPVTNHFIAGEAVEVSVLGVVRHMLTDTAGYVYISCLDRDGHPMDGVDVIISTRTQSFKLPFHSGTAVSMLDPTLVIVDILERHQSLLEGSACSSRFDAHSDSAFYMPEAINTDAPLDRLVSGLEGIAAMIRKEVRNEPYSIRQRMGEPASLMLGARLLFSGPPGTGKTAYARYLAERLNLSIQQKRASDLLSPFVGMTESNIAEAFATAEREGALLLIDEADSLFIDRRTACASWERSQTNELLTRMSGLML